MAGIIPKETIEAIRDRSDVVDVIGRYVRLQRAGANFRALCPFHREKTPSFNVSPTRQGFHCFGCGKGGDVFRFVMDHENVEFVTAARMLAEWAGMTLTLDDAAGDHGAGPRKDLLYRIHDELARWFHRQLMKEPAAQGARDYLSKRQLHADTAADFLIGYAPSSWDAVMTWGASRDFSADDLVAAGVVVSRESDGRQYDRFRDRLMFPIRDEQQRVIAFSGRALAEGAKTAKYINSPETVLFHKNRVLFGLDRARRAILEAREALICEGQIDVIRCHIAGFTTAVAAQGTAFTGEHAHRLVRLADGVVLVFDADAAGQEAAVKTAAIALQHGLAVRVAALPKGDDPDSLILAHGPDRFGEIVGRARDVIDFQLDALLAREDATTEIGMRAVTRGLTDLIQAAQDPLQRDRMIQHVAQRLVIDPAVLMRTFRATPSRRLSGREGDEAETSAEAPATRSYPPEEWALIEHLAADPDLAGLARDHLPPRRLRDADCRQALEILLAAAEAGEPDVLRFASRDAPASSAQAILAAALMAPSRIQGREFSNEDAVKDLILKIWRLRLTERLQHLLRGGGAEIDQEIRMECAHLRTDIKQLLRWDTGTGIIEMLFDETIDPA